VGIWGSGPTLKGRHVTIFMVGLAVSLLEVAIVATERLDQTKLAVLFCCTGDVRFRRFS
jgi:hypothetical protein